MATWAPPSDATLAVDKPLTQDKIRAIRDLPTALAERASGAPWVNEFGTVDVFPRFLYSGNNPDLVDEWIVPDGVYTALVTLVGGGGMGGTVTTPGTGARAGGGAGAAKIVRIDVVPGQVWSIIVGAGGSNPPDSTINQSIDDYETGDGGRTTFGIYTAAGGKHGGVGSAVEYGAGGNETSDGGTPTIKGGDGRPTIPNEYYDSNPTLLYSRTLSGDGGDSIFGPGAPGVDQGDGLAPQQSAVIDSLTRLIDIPGAGGSGSANGTTISTAYVGGKGAHGAVVVRY